jgi:hypothetical protein
VPFEETHFFLKRMDNYTESVHDVKVDSKESAFYVDAAKYWEQVPPTGILENYTN